METVLRHMTRNTKANSQPLPLPDPNDRTKERAAEAVKRNAKRPVRPQVSAETKDGKVRSIGPSHSDGRAWQETMLDAFGTTSFDFITKELLRLDTAHRNSGEAYADAQDLNAAVAAIAGMRPENEMEAMLAAQMAATHALAMRQLGHTRRAELVAQQDSHGSLAVKLLRTFTMQAEALSKLKRGGEQTVRVEHVHVHPGGQAIVGTVSGTQLGVGGGDERRRQSHGTVDARAFALAHGRPMLGQDAGGDAVPAAGDDRQEALQAPRRRGRNRRTSR